MTSYGVLSFPVVVRPFGLVTVKLLVHVECHSEPPIEQHQAPYNDPVVLWIAKMSNRLDEIPCQDVRYFAAIR